MSKQSLGDTLSAITTLKEILGTMVIMPNYKTDPNNIGKPEYIGNIQKPILEGEIRELALKKLYTIIDTL